MKKLFVGVLLLLTVLVLLLPLSSCSAGGDGKAVPKNESENNTLPENPYKYSKNKDNQSGTPEDAADGLRDEKTPPAAGDGTNGTAIADPSSDKNEASGGVTVLPDEERRQTLSPDKANDSIIIQGADIPAGFDTYAYVKRSYEIRFLFAQTSFDAPGDMSVNKLVQYAFCHLYYDHLIDMPPKTGLVYRQAPPEEIHRILLAHFGISGIDITASDLYAPDKGYFEMWEPDYASAIYFDAEVTPAGDHTYLVKTTFYTKQDKKTVKGKTEATVVYEGTDGVIKKFRSE